jgi:hypothetical protein
MTAFSELAWHTNTRHYTGASILWCVAYILWFLGPLVLVLLGESLAVITVGALLFIPWIMYPFYYTLVVFVAMYVFTVLPLFFFCDARLFAHSLWRTLVLALHAYPLYVSPLFYGGPNPIQALSSQK